MATCVYPINKVEEIKMRQELARGPNFGTRHKVDFGSHMSELEQAYKLK